MAQQEELQKKLKAHKLVHSQDGITIELNAIKEILNIEFDASLMSPERQEELQDLLVININRAMEKAEVVQSSESEALISSMMPGGLGGMFGA